MSISTEEIRQALDALVKEVSGSHGQIRAELKRATVDRPMDKRILVNKDAHGGKLYVYHRACERKDEDESGSCRSCEGRETFLITMRREQ